MDRAVPIRGAPKDAWGSSLSSRGEYLWNFDASPSDFQHWSIILGKRADGMYVLADPLSRIGTIPVTGAQILKFLDAGRIKFGVHEVWAVGKR
jgi:hypothetical protein